LVVLRTGCADKALIESPIGMKSGVNDKQSLSRSVN
jgi:hypothetical protein